MATKKDLKDYFTTQSPITPQADVTFKSADGDVTETTTNRTYVSTPNSALKDNLNKVIENADQQADKDAQDDLDALEAEVDAQEMLDESADVEFNNAYIPDTIDPESSPMTNVPNTMREAPSTTDISETAMLIKLVAALIDKIDDMQNFNPVIHVPAPVIHVTLPETKRTVTKAVERDENNWIKTVREHIEESPVGEPLIEVKKTKSIKQRLNGDSK